jgi:hypothetical protein
MFNLSASPVCRKTVVNSSLCDLWLTDLCTVIGAACSFECVHGTIITNTTTTKHDDDDDDDNNGDENSIIKFSFINMLV